MDSKNTKYQVVGGQTIAYSQHNQNMSNTIVLVHGNMSDGAWWNELIDLLKPSYRIIAVDLRGFGKSTYNTPPNSLDDYAQDVITLCQQKSIKSFVLVGWSFGGFVSFKIAELANSMVTHLILVCSTGHKGIVISNSEGVPVASLEQLKKQPKLAMMISLIEARDQNALRKAFDFLLYKYMGHVTEDRKNELVLSCLNQRNYLNVVFTLTNFESDLTKITAPILALNGKHDAVVPFSNIKPTLQWFEARKHPLKVVSYDNAAHMLPLQVPQPVFQEIVQFIKH